jgi:hypothetical protein
MTFPEAYLINVDGLKRKLAKTLSSVDGLIVAGGFTSAKLISHTILEVHFVAYLINCDYLRIGKPDLIKRQ